MPGGTREHLLDAAERLFADLGIAAASMRRIARKARANLAAAHYHFGSKKGLIHAVLRRRLGALNGARLKCLDEAERKGKLSLEEILRAFLMPTLELWQNCPQFLKLAGRIQTTPDKELVDFFYSEFREVAARFLPTLKRVLPKVPDEEIFWRSQFMIGAMLHVWTSAEGLARFSAGRYRVGDGRAVLERLVDFAAEGLRVNS